MDDLPEIRTASSMAAAAQMVGSFGDTLMAGLRAKLAEEQAEMRLQAITRPAWAAFVLAEVERRAEVYAEAWRSRLEPPPPDMTPRCSALMSVGDDVARGILG